MNAELEFVRGMFDAIAPRYDFLNRLLSLRQDVYWRKEMVKAAALTGNALVLDVACGTCDVALEIFSQTRGTARIAGLDFSRGMLVLGKKKLAGHLPSAPIRLVNADALFLPFGRCLFDGIFIAFGIRNIMNRKQALVEFQNALKPGKRVVILELTTPENPVLKSLYLLYFKRILPRIGELFSNHRQAYHYLPDSVLGFPKPREFARIMASAGFRNIRFKPMTAGIVTLFVGEKAGRKEEPL